jgi:ubiquinone/menaquinone biosynthesis C-methylase UbiE
MTEQTYGLSAEAAEFYESTFVPALFGEWAGRLVDAAGVAPGGSVLDVACGTGVVARTAADRLGPAATVVGVDVNPAMVAVGRRLRPDLRWDVGDAGALPYGDDSFDLVLSQAGLMFFGDRVAALREMGRVAGPNGRVVVQVPGRLSASAGYLALTETVARHAAPEVLDVLGGYFAVGDPDLLAGLFRDAGLTVDRFETWRSATRMASLEDFLTAELLPIADRVDQTARDRIAEECRTTLAPYIDASGAVNAPIEVHLVTARVG